LNFPQFPGSRNLKTAKSGRPLLGLDYHNHVLPGVDDGVASFAQAKLAIAGLQLLGFSGAVLTPHIYAGVFNNIAESLQLAFAAFTKALAETGMAFPLHLAGEYFADENFLKLIEKNEILHIRVADERWVLLEFPFLQEAPFAGACLAALVARGYRPVIAHVERYRFVLRAQEEWLDRFARAGALLQGDIGSLAGQHGDETQHFARRLAERHLVEIWGTDLHHPRQIEKYIVPGLARLAAIGGPAAGLY
jgi:tyrosine-protein phosphatase YwqE